MTITKDINVELDLDSYTKLRDEIYKILDTLEVADSKGTDKKYRAQSTWDIAYEFINNALNNRFEDPQFQKLILKGIVFRINHIGTVNEKEIVASTSKTRSRDLFLWSKVIIVPKEDKDEHS